MAGIFALCACLMRCIKRRGGGKMFDFSKEKKEKYYKKAERILEENELTKLLIDREGITIRRNEIVIIHIIPSSTADVTRQEMATLKKIKECVVKCDKFKRYPGKPKPMYASAHFEFALEECDR